MSNSVDPDEMAHYELSGLHCLQKPIIIAYGSERVKINYGNRSGQGESVNIILSP